MVLKYILFTSVLLVFLIGTAQNEIAVEEEADDDEELKSETLGEIQCPNSGGKLQSPILLGRLGSKKEIEKGGVRSIHSKKDTTITQFYGNKYYGKIRDRFYAHNNGETYYFQFNPYKQTSELTIRGEGWEDEYVFAMGRLHWGANSTNGSEHMIHGESFPLELQLVHYRKSVGNLQDARKKTDGVVILSILYKVDEERPNPALNPLIQGASSVYFPGPMKQIHGPVRMKSLFPRHMAYYEYLGSFTSPPCDEGVKWVVFEEPQILATSQLRTLRKLVLENGASMVNNFRQIQPTNQRIIKYSGPAVLNIKLTTVLNIASSLCSISLKVMLFCTLAVCLRISTFDVF